jgi:subtilase family serine protease
MDIRMTVPRRRTRWLATAGALALSVAAAAFSLPDAASAATPATHHYSVHPLVRQYSTGKPNALPQPSECIANYGLACYTPAQIRKAYNIPASYTGQGQKIAIVDAFGSPTAAADLATFSTTFGLPAADFHVYCPNGCAWPPAASVLDDAYGWAEEVSLDVQWAHAIAPRATINLVVSASDDNAVMNQAMQYAVSHNLGDVLSMSFGTDESDNHGDSDQFIESHAIFAQAAAKGISLFAAAGDWGASDSQPVQTALYPASDPLVTGVGGTNLYADDNGNYQSETVWNDSDPSLCPFGCSDGAFGATGGAVSTYFAAPSYQRGTTNKSMRAISDVSYNASVYTSVWVVISFFPDPSQNGFYFFGGTSSGSPQWAAIGALANQRAGHRLGQLNPLLYAIARSRTDYARDFHDVTVGQNAWFGPGYSAGRGWDLPTGLGSPNVANLIGSLTRR